MWLFVAVLAGLYLLRRWHRERQRVPDLANKYVLITGCDSGFGSLLARQLDARGLRVLAACLTEPGAARLRAAASPRLQTLVLDVTSSESIAAAAAWVEGCVGDRGLWGLVNNAGVVHPVAPNEWLRKEDFVRVLNVNLVGLVEVTLSLLPLVRRARGRVVNVASILGRLSFFGGGYCPSKYGVEAFSDSLRRELRDFGVHVAIVEPGYFRTGMTDIARNLEALEQVWERAPASVRESYGQRYFESLCKVFEESLRTRCSSDLSLVTGCMEHALTAAHPRMRYAAGWDARLHYIPLSYLPTALADRLLAPALPRPAQAP
ncbi:17-beta-hydroxysteroid dehydrogenase type 6-like [Apteryx mantelli]|uniref:17-beta-hydroxysteroid dehydrogenase type 6-like n=1 Tax=Apteryx mantelli TaxID=2696672 RepID=A0ABM4FZ38_9AVES